MCHGSPVMRFRFLVRELTACGMYVYILSGRYVSLFHMCYSFVINPFESCSEIVQTRRNTKALFEDVCLRNYRAHGRLDVHTEFVNSTALYLVIFHYKYIDHILCL